VARPIYVTRVSAECRALIDAFRPRVLRAVHHESALGLAASADILPHEDVAIARERELERQYFVVGQRPEPLEAPDPLADGIVAIAVLAEQELGSLLIRIHIR
jgi:hypothetical protein